jgi:predicted NACHT family NTPase
MFSRNFLTDLARKYELSPEQEEVFLLWWGNDKSDREISEQLHVTAEAIRNRKTGIYKKFSIAGSGANKANKFRNRLDAEAKKQNVEANLQPNDDLEALVQEVKQKIAADVMERCGTMRVLDMTQPVDLDRIYTDVNILEKISGKDRIDCDEVLPIGNRENFERWMMGKIQHRITGLKAFEKHQKLVVLGKPGAGKTTFMKYLAMSCLAGRFHGELVPIFVTLKAYAEERGQPSLENYILTEFAKRKVSQDVAKQLLDNGKALILLDGLDEVKKEDDRRVKQDIDCFSRDWLKNRFAITCRIAAREYQFEKFTEVEVADFDDGQIETFVNNWFRERDELKAERMLERLKVNKPVKELAKSPLLLSLLCWRFEENDEFPENRHNLLTEGLNFLLKKWDATRYVERDVSRHFRGEQIYKNLSPEEKIDMLTGIAFRYFLNDEYFFRQEDLQQHIKDYICKLPEYSNNLEASRLDSEAVLKAIEHHHGLLVERARNIYSFSHLTFQEYFTAQEIEREKAFGKYIQHVTDPRWREVFLLTAEMLRSSDEFLLMIKEYIDGILLNNENLQVFLEWANQKTNSVQSSYKNVAVRAFYAYYEVPNNPLQHALALQYFLEHACNFDVSLSLDRSLLNSLESALDISISIALEYDISLALSIDISRTHRLFRAGAFSLDLSTSEGSSIDISLSRATSLDISLNISLSIANHVGEPRFHQCLQSIIDRLLDPNQDWQRFKEWWKLNGQEWTKEYRQLLINDRNIGHDWQFTDEQLELLNQYYAANLLLVECMNRSYVSKQVREEIESTMLLPSKK